MEASSRTGGHSAMVAGVRVWSQILSIRVLPAASMNIGWVKSIPASITATMTPVPVAFGAWVSAPLETSACHKPSTGAPVTGAVALARMSWTAVSRCVSLGRPVAIQRTASSATSAGTSRNRTWPSTWSPKTEWVWNPSASMAARSPVCMSVTAIEASGERSALACQLRYAAAIPTSSLRLSADGRGSPIARAPLRHLDRNLVLRAAFRGPSRIKKSSSLLDIRAPGTRQPEVRSLS